MSCSLSDYKKPHLSLLDKESQSEKDNYCIRLYPAIENNSLSEFNGLLPIILGKNHNNVYYIIDIVNMPHLIIAGATGQGKSVCAKSILSSILFAQHPSDVKLVLFDTKKVEFMLYRVIEKHFLAKLPGEEDPIVYDKQKAALTLNALCIEMDNRLEILNQNKCSNIIEFNNKLRSGQLPLGTELQAFPFIVLMIDDYAELVLSNRHEIEQPIFRLTQNGRITGIHVIIITSSPTESVLTDQFLCNFPTRLSFKLSSRRDSKRVLNHYGAESLLGLGDLFINFNSQISHLKGTYVSNNEVKNVCEFIGEQLGYPRAFLLPEYVDENEIKGGDFNVSELDPLFEDAARLIVLSQIGSTSLIQRRMKLGYNRAGKLMDQLEAAGVVGPNQGSKAREVLFKTDMELQEFLDAMS